MTKAPMAKTLHHGVWYVKCNFAVKLIEQIANFPELVKPATSTFGVTAEVFAPLYIFVTHDDIPRNQ